MKNARRALTHRTLPVILFFLITISIFAIKPCAALGATTGLWITPLELDFGPMGVGTTSPEAVVTITNYSTSTLDNFSGGGLSSPFGVSQDCAGGVPPGGQCHYYFRFSPTAEGDFSATSSSGSSLGNISIKVRGRGVGAKVVYDAHALDMGSLALNANAAQQVVTLRNVGLARLESFAGGGLATPFSASQDCADGVDPGGSCHYYFGFSPTTVGSFSATSSTASNGGPVSISVKGSGRPQLSFGSGQRVSPFSLDFGPVGVGTTSPELQARLVNQNLFSAISDFTGGGVNAPFQASQDCAGGVPAGGNCAFYYRFSPTTAGEFSATSFVTNSFGSFSVQLHGTGVAPALSASPLWLDFGPQAFNTSSAIQTVTITNTGLTPLQTWIGGGVPAPFSASQDCAGGLQPGASCKFYYTFTPSGRGFFTATSTISTEAGPFSIALQGGAHASEYLVALTKNGDGSGSVTSSPARISCGSTCSGAFTAGSTITLSGTPDEFSLFSGWSGACSGTGACSLTVTADRSVTASFSTDTAHKARIGTSNYFPSLTLAYQAASAISSDTIQAWGTDFTENLTCDDFKHVIVSGGFNGDYSSSASRYTSLHGVLTLKSGSLTVDRLVIL